MLDVKKLLTKICKAVGFYSENSTSSDGTLTVRRIFNAVNVSYEGTAKTYNTGAYNLIATLGVNERPSTTIYSTAYNNNTNDITKAPLIVYINTSGQIYVWVFSGQGNVAPRFNITFLKSGSII